MDRTPHGSSQKDLVGAREGALGDAEGATLSEETKVVGDTDGLTLGALEGASVGLTLGALEGASVGTVGAYDGGGM